MALTFVIVFLMNYIGSDYPDRLQRALMTGASGAIFLAIGLWIYGKFGKDDGTHHDFD